MHLLAILQGDSSEKVTELVQAVSRDEDQPSVLSYLPLFVDDKTIESNLPKLKELAWPLP